jgi:hypothetical protein
VGPVTPATPFIRKPVLKTTPSSPLQSVVTSLAADGAVTQALTHSLDSTVAHLPDLFKSTAPAPPVVAVQKTVATVKAASPALLGRVLTPSDFIPSKVQAIAREVVQWWSRPRASRLADCAVPNRATDALIVEGRSSGLGNFRVTGMLTYPSSVKTSVCVADRGPLWCRAARYPPHPRGTPSLPYCT